ncbi:MAG: rhombotarget lipoprotein [Gammaproteobacteria bacterium]|nr:rhombotarget lipoprotein [Gammaproteobacteria bacterium]
MRKLILAMTLLPLLAGCSMFLGGQEQFRQGASSSLVDFLYPDGTLPPKADGRMPHLELPLRVGIAFVPSNSYRDISETDKQALLDKVASQFRDKPYVQTIDTIPETYLRSTSGTRGMQQVASLYDLDVVALVSYDQVSYSGERDSALLYWTIVGTMFVKGNSNEVQTMIDTAVFDAETAKLLFRAPGIHRQQENTTLVDNARDLRHLQTGSFDAATGDMIENLERELVTFKDAVENGERAETSWRSGSGGGGSIGLPLLGLFVVFGILANARRRQQNRRRR